MLSIKNLHACVENAENGGEILKGLNLEVNAGEVHAIMGPNGSGKSTLSKVIAGHPDYIATEGTLTFTPQGSDAAVNLLELAADERARAGVFLAFQYPVEIPGVSNLEFLRASYNAVQRERGADEIDLLNFEQLLKRKAELLAIDESFIRRPVNVDFSGGEKKRNEILQMAVLDPQLAVLDETDSGLDVDSLRIVADGVNALKREDNAIVLITHYQRLLNYIIPDFVHILHNGQIIKTGGKELALEIEDRGYDWLIGKPTLNVIAP